MIQFDSAEDEQFLKRSMERGEVILILGAGASASSENRSGVNVPMAGALAEFIANHCGQPYSDESLTDVLAATVPVYIGEQQLFKILNDLYCGTRPADELQHLFEYTWRRLYTLNIDDTIENSTKGVQHRRYYNGLIDKAAESGTTDVIQVIHLHGEAIKPEHGFILTSDDYNRWLTSGNHSWYSKLAEDYANFTPVFIGTRLQEPILSAELHRARGQVNSGLGRAFVVTPDSFTSVQAGSYRARNLIPVQGYLSDFSDWLRATFSKRLSPVDVAAEVSKVAREIATRHAVSLADLETARSLFLIEADATAAEVGAWTLSQRRQFARAFLEGGPPTWRIASSDVPVKLDAAEALYTRMKLAVSDRTRVFVAYGQSGSGKTTAILQCLLRLSKENPDQKIYELRGEVKSLRSALHLLSRIHPDEHLVLYISDVFVFGDSFEEDVLSITHGRVTVVTSARSGEWRDHLERRIGDVAVSYLFQRFSHKDHRPLIDRLISFVPAPKLLKMSPTERLERLAKSKSQLLIALKETTEGELFTKVITDEFAGLPDDDTRALVLLAGIATLARVGMAPGAIREAYERLRTKRSFDEAVRATEGIVLKGQGGRFVARHELYVRHVIENVAELKTVASVVIEALRTFAKYKHPIYKNVDRYDGILFRFLLNHNFVRTLVRQQTGVDDVIRIYESFEIEFQLDGHFWLQYGQFLVEIGRIEPALRVLQKSIEAYPDNEFATHALADVQLKAAYRRPVYDAEARTLMGEAVKTLLEQDARLDWESDQYPIVTLTFGHIGALLRHKQVHAAKEAAAQYFDRVQRLAKRRHNNHLQAAQDALLRFLSTGEWVERQGISGRQKAGRHRRPRKRGAR